MNLYDSVNTVLKRLDDYPAVAGERVWTRAEIELYLHDGYNAFCRQTKCLLDFFYPENRPRCGNYVALWELGYYQSGMVAVGVLGFTGGYWEQDYAEASAAGPVTSTQPWESLTYSHVETRTISWEDVTASHGRSRETVASGDCELSGDFVGLTATDTAYGDFNFQSASAPPDTFIRFYYRTELRFTSAANPTTWSIKIESGVVNCYVDSALVYTYPETPSYPLWVYGIAGSGWESAPPTLTSIVTGTSFVDTVFPVSIHPVPEDNVAVDRATHDFGTLDPEFTRWLEQNDRSFQTTAGTPSRFSMDRDGMNRLRIVPAGSGQATTATVSGTFGLLRSAGDTDGFGTWAPIGSWGALKEIPEHFPMGGQYGIPRRLYSDEDNTRVEYFRLGKDLDEYALELPARFAKYVEFFAQAKALERDGPGQDAALAQHFMGRFGDGVRRMVLRLSENKRSRLSAIGSSGKRSTRPALARLPYRYGRSTRGVY